MRINHSWQIQAKAVRLEFAYYHTCFYLKINHEFEIKNKRATIFATKFNRNVDLRPLYLPKKGAWLAFVKQLIY